VHGESALGGGTNACGLEEEAAGRLKLHARTAHQCLDRQQLCICLQIASSIRTWCEHYSLLFKVLAPVAVVFDLNSDIQTLSSS